MLTPWRLARPAITGALMSRYAALISTVSARIDDPPGLTPAADATVLSIGLAATVAKWKSEP